MSSSPIIRNSHSHASHKQQIPANLVLNWHSSAAKGSKPLTRRPRTACQKCRTAKVKCPGDGEHECSRCISRRLSCTYLQQSSSSSITSSRRRCETNRNSQEDIQTDLSAETLGHFEGAIQATPQLLRSSVGWSNMNDMPLSESLEQHAEWDTLDPFYNWTSDMSPQMGHDQTGVPLDSSISTADHTLTSEEQRFLSGLGLFPLVTSSTATDLSSQNQLLYSQGCQCRAGLAVFIPSVRTALQKQQLDGVYQVTDDLIKKCQGVINCSNCNVNCTDLICIVTNFQEADGCFEYIAKGDIDKGAMRISFGSYKTAMEEKDTKHWRQIIVSQFVTRANELLNSISARGQDMLKRLDPACRLGRVNIDYLEAVIRNSRETLRRIMKELREEIRTVE